jgi:hypothetical protein
MNVHIKQSLNTVLAGGAIAAGWWVYGWQGIVLAVTVIVFWMLLQFNRATRVLQRAGQRPIGEIDSIVMMQAKLAHGQNMQEVIALAGSLGRKFSERDEWQWTDLGGNEIVVTFRRGVVVRWAVARQDTTDTETTTTTTTETEPPAPQELPAQPK